VATDASKGYPDTSVASNPFGTNIAGALLPAGATFFEGTATAGFRAVPRYPSNVYYNVSKQGQQLDEYNWIYYRGPVVRGMDGNCDPVLTACRTTPATWADYVGSENRIMFGHLMGNDPRPHYAHQSNLADWNPALPATDPQQGGILYAVVDGLLDNWYDKYFDRASTPLVQLTQTAAANELARQAKWASDVANGRVSAYLQNGELHITATEDMQVPVTGTAVGELYGGQRSGITTVKATTPVVVPVPTSPSTQSKPDEQQSAPATSTDAEQAAPTPAGPATPTRPATRPATARAKVKLTRLTMSPRRFAVRHPRGTRHRNAVDGSTVTWRLNRAATVRLKVQRRVRGHWKVMGTVSRKARQGQTTLRFAGRVHGRLLANGRYRMVVTATAAGRTTTARTLPFRVVRG
jgi:hypothetical protein